MNGYDWRASQARLSWGISVILAVVACCGGCTAAAIHEQAVRMQRHLDTFVAASAPDPRYIDPHATEYSPRAVEAWHALAAELRSDARAIEEATR